MHFKSVNYINPFLSPYVKLCQMNELIFFTYCFALIIANVIALKISKEALIALISVEAILINLFVLKEITLFGLIATASDALAVGITLGLNFLQEYYGRDAAQRAVTISMCCSVFYILISQLHLAYSSAIIDTSSVHFDALLRTSPRIVLASIFVYYLVQNLDCYLYAYLSKKLERKHFLLRNYLSVSITQLLDTILFSFLGLWKLNSAFDSILVIGQIIVISYIIKLIAIFLSASYLAIAKKFIKL